MPVEKVRFRCFKCNQLLAISPARIGTIVACPRCEERLIVPDPDQPNDGPLVSDSPDVAEILTGDDSLNLSINTAQPLQAAKSAVSKLPSEPLPDLSHLTSDPNPETRSAPELPEFEVPVPEAIAAPRSSGRRSDVTIPRAVVLYWSMFVILAQLATFVAGLMIGHFVWKTPIGR